MEKIDEEQKKNIEIANDLTKERFKELCEMELQKNVLYEKTYCKMIDKEDDRKVNNNIRLVFNKIILCKTNAFITKNGRI